MIKVIGYWLLPSLSKKTADKADEEIIRIDYLEKQSHKPRGLWFSFFDERILDGELNQKNEGAEPLKDICVKDQLTITDNIPVGIMRCFACPAHALTEERAP